MLPPSDSRAFCWIHTRTQVFFYRFVACAFPFFEVKSVLPIDRYQNATSKAISQHELKKVQLQERYTLVTQDSIGHLKTLCMSVLSLVVALESEWKRYSSSQSDKKYTSVRVWIQLYWHIDNCAVILICHGQGACT